MIRKLELKIVENLVEHSFFIVLPVELTVPKSKIFTDPNDPLTRLIKGLYHLTKWNKLE